MGPPIFSPEIFFNKMTQNGLKWILNTTSKSMEFCRSDPPHTFFFEGFPNQIDDLIRSIMDL